MRPAPALYQRPRLLGAWTLVLALGGTALSAHAMLPGEMMEMGDHHDEQQMAGTATAGAQVPLVCVQRGDPATGTSRRVTATAETANDLGGVVLSAGPCAEQAAVSDTRSNQYDITHLPETLLRGGIPQSPLQTVVQVILAAFIAVLEASGHTPYGIHAHI